MLLCFTSIQAYRFVEKKKKHGGNVNQCVLIIFKNSKSLLWFEIEIEFS